jgi:deferrochelatase/peroxidase EfeB
VATAKQEYLHFLALDLLTEDLSEVRELLRAWTEATARMTDGKPARGKIASAGTPPYDAGKTFGLFSARRKLTFGFGPTLFERDVEDRFGLAGTTPGAWTPTSGSRATLARHNEGRRSDGYSFTDGFDAERTHLDAGLFFICLQRAAREQFVTP